MWESIVKELGLTTREVKPKVTMREVKPKEPKVKASKDVASIIQIVQDWIPSRRYKSEETYQTDLRHFLEKHGLDVQEEAGVTNVDILVENSIPIEIKKDPNRNDFDRLIGQIDRHIELYGKLIVVICRLQTRDLFNEYKRRCEDKYSSEQLIWIIK